MKLTDEKILKVALANGVKKSREHWGDRYYTELGSDLFRFARAILKEAGVEELERDAEQHPLKRGMIFKLDAWHAADMWLSRAGSDELSLRNVFAAGAKWAIDEAMKAK